MEMVVLDADGDAGNADSGCLWWDTYNAVMDVNGDTGNACAGCEWRHWKCLCWTHMATFLGPSVVDTLHPQRSHFGVEGAGDHALHTEQCLLWEIVTFSRCSTLAAAACGLFFFCPTQPMIRQETRSCPCSQFSRQTNCLQMALGEEEGQQFLDAIFCLQWRADTRALSSLDITFPVMNSKLHSVKIINAVTNYKEHVIYTPF